MAFKHGDRVQLIGERRIGTIQGEARPFAGEDYFTVAFSDGSTKRYAEADLESFEGPKDVPSLIEAGSFGGRQNLSALITLTKLQGDLSNHIYAFYASRTQFFPHQFKAVIKYVDSAKKRLLIADEVGLGKTIEAGLIMAEERARGPLRRVLVVCPSTLRQKWQIEMAKRFDESFRILDTAAIRAFLREVRERGDAAELRGICSLQTIRNESLLEELEADPPPFDLVVVDEAHHMRNSATLSNRAGQLLSEAADGMVLMTATPVHLGNQNLFQLLRILDPDEFQELQAFERRLRSNEVVIQAQSMLGRKPLDLAAMLKVLRGVEAGEEAERFQANPVYQDLVQRLSSAPDLNHAGIIEVQRDLTTLNLLGHVLTRTRKREVYESSPLRSPVVLSPSLSLKEARCYAEVTDFCMRWYSQRSENPIESFASITIQRQLASCLPATIDRYLDSREPVDPNDLEEASGEEEERTLPPTAPTTLPQIAQDPAFQSILRSYAELRNEDSKLDELVAYLKRLEEAEGNRQLVVFSTFKSTIGYLERKLSRLGLKCLVISGDVPSTPDRPETDERGRRLEAFKSDRSVRILLSTEVGSEGLDLQFCHVLVNYDLPWNPMVVEQRIGRLDRIGQRSKRIVVANFSIPGTIEERILTRLYNRIGIFERSIGDLEPILGEHMRDMTRVLMSPELTGEEKVRQLDQTALALEKKRQELSRLEEDGAQLIGHDEFFRLELDRVRKLRRYITGRELEVFVGEFLKREFPTCELRATGVESVAELTLDDRLRNFLREMLSSEDRWLMAFLVRSGRGKVVLTFDSQTATERSDVDLIHNSHPLVRAIRAWVQKNPTSIDPVSRIELMTDVAPPGDYLFEVFLLEVQGGRTSRVIEPVILKIKSGAPLDVEVAEELLAMMVESGTTMAEMPDLEGDAARGLLKQIDQVFGERLIARKREIQRSNDALVANRLGSLDGTYRVKLERQRSRIRKAEANPASKAQYLGMVRGALVRLETEYEAKRKVIASGKQFTISPNVFAGGFLRVKAPDRRS